MHQNICRHFITVGFLLAFYHHKKRVLEYITAVCFESNSTDGKFSGMEKVFDDFEYDTEKGVL